MIKRNLIVAAIAVLAVFFAMVWLIGASLTDSVNASIDEPPADISLNSVRFPSASGAAIRGWFLKGIEGKGAVILMHGVRANRLAMLERARFLNKNGFSVLLFDFQAHGESVGEEITFGYLESRDASAAIQFVGSQMPQEKIGVIGVSMGGATLLLAKSRPDVDAVILEMVYPTIEQAVSNRIAVRLGNWSKILTPLLTWQLKPRLGISADDLRPVDRVGELKTPKLFIAGENDRHTTLAESQTLFDAASEPKEFWTVPNAGHEDIHLLAKEDYEHRVLTFFGEYITK